MLLQKDHLICGYNLVIYNLAAPLQGVGVSPFFNSVSQATVK